MIGLGSDGFSFRIRSIIIGRCTFEQVPNKLKQQVAEILVEECGMPELVPSEFGGTKDAKTAKTA